MRTSRVHKIKEIPDRRLHMMLHNWTILRDTDTEKYDQMIQEYLDRGLDRIDRDDRPEQRY